MSREKYAHIVLSIMPRVLSSIDDNPLSGTYGCVDKAYWFYKTKDFPCARLQEVALTLALLYKNKFSGNIYYNIHKIKELSIAALNYALKIQHKDGSFDEWYPNEHSYVGTAFPLYKLSETYLILGLDEPKLISMFEKAACFLAKTEETVANQIAGSILALYNIYLLTSNNVYLGGVNVKLELLKNMQSSEGWFPEYGGPDIGYLSLLIDFLGRYYLKSKDEEILKLIYPSIEFFKYMVYPDGSLGGIIGSRGTEFKFPYGFQIFSKKNSSAKYIADMIYDGINSSVNPEIMDDQYAFEYHDSYLYAYLDNLPFEKQKPFYFKPMLFKESGLYVENSKERYLIINLKKGGVYTLFKKGSRVDNSGIFVKLNGKILTSQWLNSSGYLIDKNQIIVKGNMYELYSMQQLSPLKNSILRLFLSTLGNISKIAFIFKFFLRNKLIKKANKTKFTFERKFIFDKDILVIDNNSCGKFLSSHKFKTNYVPTSRFYNFRLD